MSEPTIVINGVKLSEAEAMTVRVAMNAFSLEHDQPDALGEDEVGRSISASYKKHTTEVMRLLHQKGVKIFLDGKEFHGFGLPQGPLFIVWGPEGETPVKHVFTRIDWAQKAAANMAMRYANTGQIFYVATLISWHQQQVQPVWGRMRCQIG